MIARVALIAGIIPLAAGEADSDDVKRGVVMDTPSPLGEAKAIDDLRADLKNVHGPEKRF